MLKHLYHKIINYDLEEKKLLYYLKKYVGKGEVLDVGCGYGRILKLLKKNNINAQGVEINPEIVNSCLLSGLRCESVKDFFANTNSGKKWDVILMFHVIEHMEPEKCLEVIDSYLDFLKPGGILIIATPILTDYFYEDFDHVKPYLPVGIQMVFGANNAQVQFRSRNKIELLDLWYKKFFYRPTNFRFVYFPGLKMKLVNLISALMFKASIGYLGKKDGWMGIFRKI